MKLSNGLQAVAVIEAAKGLLVLAAGAGLLALIHRDAQLLAEQLVERSHLNPASHYPHIFVELAGRATTTRLWLLAAAALCYALIRFIEAIGLWHEQRWAEWFGAASGSIFVPMELYELGRGVTWAKLLILIVNIGVVGYLGYVLWRSRRRRGEPGEQATAPPRPNPGDPHA